MRLQDPFGQRLSKAVTFWLVERLLTSHDKARFECYRTVVEIEHVELAEVFREEVPFERKILDIFRLCPQRHPVTVFKDTDAATTFVANPPCTNNRTKHVDDVLNHLLERKALMEPWVLKTLHRRGSLRVV